MNIPDLIDGPPLCGGRKGCTKKGWIGAANTFLCSDCYTHWVKHRERKEREAADEAFL